MEAADTSRCPDEAGSGSLCGCPRSWKRALGLLSRASVLTLQRLLDVLFVCTHSWWSLETYVLGLALFFTTVLSALTMKKHWSARLNNRPHGVLVGCLTALLQIAPLWEMVDKLCFRVFDEDDPPNEALLSPLRFWSSAAAEEGQRTPNLGFAIAPPIVAPPPLPPVRTQRAPPQSTPKKGGEGENMMRGVRKLTMVNIPQAMASLWCHIYLLMPVYPPPDAGSVVLNAHATPRLLLAFGAALLSLAFGVGDFVLYVWVDDAFVRSNKTYVIVHYLLEILSRVPTVVLFHITYSRYHHYWPTWRLLLYDTLVTSALLMLTRVHGPRRCFCICTRETVAQLLYSFFISTPLFFVNIVFFDPGMSFFYVNQVFYMVKYLELLVMWILISRVRSEFAVYAQELYGLPRGAYTRLWWATLAFTLGNAIMVFAVIPWKRGIKIEDFVTALFSPECRKVSPSKSFSRMFTGSADSTRTTPLLKASLGYKADRCHSLEHIEEIFEMLWMLSKASRTKNRIRVLNVTVRELWLQALPWDGLYSDGAGGEVHVAIHSLMGVSSLSIRRALEKAPVLGSRFEAPVLGSLSGNVVVMKDGQLCEQRGAFDGLQIYWDNGDVWTKTSGAYFKEFGALHLVLPQLALALRWDSQPNPVGDDGARQSPSDSGKCNDAASLHDQRPLLDFLVRYAIITRQSDFISDLYWTLVCLSHEDAFSDGAHRMYRDARHALLEALQCGAGRYFAPQMQEGVEEFLQVSRKLLQNQREIWRQHMELLHHHSGRSSGGGAWSVRTSVLRRALQNWTEHRRQAKAADEEAFDAEDELLLLPLSASFFSRSSSVDLVSPADTAITLSLPIDPGTQFCGIVIDESEVIPSKQAPLMLVCRTKRRTRSASKNSSVDESEEPTVGRERYLLKFGDDLRQDQLLLQMMSLMGRAWEESLHSTAVELLKVVNFKVLAITPRAGYVKCVPDAIPLSTALHQSQGLLDVWLRNNCPPDLPFDEALDNLCGSVAASCVVTYVLGIGDRHLENICITPTGIVFHIDFSFVFGDDPKPIAPPVRLPQQVAQALRRTKRLSKCFRLAGEAYLALRPYAGLLGSLLRLTAEAGGAGCSRLAAGPGAANAAIAGVRERLRVDQADEMRVISEFLCLMRESSEGLASVILDKIHAAGLFWR